MTTLYAQPCDITATGFYFDTEAEYDAKAAGNFNSFGGLVDEYEIQFIEGEAIDAKLFEALAVHQGNISEFFDVVDAWSGDEKIRVIIAVGECGYRFDLGKDDPSRFDLDMYECESLRDLAMQFVDEGLFGDIPAPIANYLDYEAIARDLSADYSETVIDGERYIYRCG